DAVRAAAFAEDLRERRGCRLLQREDPSPGHSVAVVPSVRRKPKPYFRSCVPCSAFRNDVASTLAVCCGRRLRLWLNEPYDVPVVRSRPAFVPIPPSGVSRNPVL